MKRISLSRILTGVLAFAMAVSMTACGANTKYIASVNGEDIPAGLYVISQMQAVTEAQNHEEFDETLTNVRENVLDGTDFDSWVLARAKEMVEEYAAVNAMFEEEGMAFTADQQEAVEYYVENMWYYYEAPYTECGISKDSYTKYVENQYKYTDLFMARYDEGGDDPVAREEVLEELEKSYAVVQVLPFSTIDAETGESMDDAGKQKQYELAKDYMERVNAGESMANLRLELERTNAEDSSLIEMDPGEYKVTIQNGLAMGEISAKLCNAIFESAELETPVVLSDDNGYYVVYRYEAMELPENYDTYKSECLLNLKEEEFDALVDTYAKTMDIQFYDAAVKGLKLDKILE